MQRISAALALVSAIAFADAGAGAAQNCPATDNVSARSRLEYFHLVEWLTAPRDSLGIQQGAHTRARVLTNASPDAWICDRLRSTVGVPALLQPPYIYTIYEIDGRYYIVWVIGPVEETRPRFENGVFRMVHYHAPFSIFDASGNPIFDDLF